MEHRLISAGAASLRTHWHAGKAPTTIQDGQDDHVVLPEQSTLPVKNAPRMHENVRLPPPLTCGTIVDKVLNRG
jgi:hypothetical protein